jgi:hypothetical protein
VCKIVFAPGFPLSLNQGDNDRYLYNAESAAEAARGRTATGPSGQDDAVVTGSVRSTVFTLRAIAFYTWGNVLLVFIPVGIVTYLCGASPSILFSSSAIAIIPLSGLLTYATESIASDIGDTVGALMNISFGNLIEVVIF